MDGKYRRLVPPLEEQKCEDAGETQSETDGNINNWPPAPRRRLKKQGKRPCGREPLSQGDGRRPRGGNRRDLLAEDKSRMEGNLGP